MKSHISQSCYGGDGTHGFIGMNVSQIHTMSYVEAKFCEYLSFRIHVSPNSIIDESPKLSSSFSKNSNNL